MCAGQILNVRRIQRDGLAGRGHVLRIPCFRSSLGRVEKPVRRWLHGAARNREKRRACSFHWAAKRCAANVPYQFGRGQARCALKKSLAEVRWCDRATRVAVIVVRSAFGHERDLRTAGVAVGRIGIRSGDAELLKGIER